MVNDFKYGAKGIALTESSEALRLTVYDDGTGTLTVGWGHTSPGLVLGAKITFAQAIALLQSDTAAPVTFVNHVVTVPLNQNQFDALVDFTFNEGVGSFLHSSLLRAINEGNFTLADTEFAPWDEAGGKVLGGLVARRAKEAALFAEPV